MGLWCAGRTGVLAAAVLGVLAGCAGDDTVPPYSVCSVGDGDGRRYQAKDLNAVAALQTAISECTVTARDPTTCQQQGCQATW
jgi:hypothetical protein